MCRGELRKGRGGHHWPRAMGSRSCVGKKREKNINVIIVVYDRDQLLPKTYRKGYRWEKQPPVSSIDMTDAHSYNKNKAECVLNQERAFLWISVGSGHCKRRGVVRLSKTPSPSISPVGEE